MCVVRLQPLEKNHGKERKEATTSGTDGLIKRINDAQMLQHNHRR